MTTAAIIGADGLWSDRPLEVTVRRAGEIVMRQSLNQPFARIGSHPSADVVLPDENLAGCQVYLHGTAEGIYCLGLTARTPHGWLREKSYAPLGEYRAYARFGDEGPPASALDYDLRKTSGQVGAWPQLEIRGREGKRAVGPLPRQLTVVGRDAPSMLRFADDQVSGVHCALFWDGRSLWVIDLLSGGGTLLDGRRIQAARVQQGHDILIGNNRLRWLDVVRNDHQQLSQSLIEQRAQFEKTLSEVREQARTDIATMQVQRDAALAKLAARPANPTLENCQPAAPSLARSEVSEETFIRLPDSARQPVLLSPALDELSYAARPIKSAPPPPADKQRASPLGEGQGLLGEQLIERLLEFKSKRERRPIRRRALWAAAAMILLLTAAGILVAIRLPWHTGDGRTRQDATRPSLGDFQDFQSR